MKFKNYFSSIFKNSSKNKLSKTDQKFKLAISRLVGYSVNNLEVFKKAFTIKSCNYSSTDEVEHYNNERLEFLGDAVLGSIISCYIFSGFPNGNEGFLTQMKSKIVSRKSLNSVGKRLNLVNYILNKDKNTILSDNIDGNLFEALVGAIYQDVDYSRCRNVILNHLLTTSEISNFENRILSYKSLLLEWAQKQKINIKFDTEQEDQNNKTQNFRSCIWINEKRISNACEISKKKAEEKASQRAFYALNPKEKIHV